MSHSAGSFEDIADLGLLLEIKGVDLFKLPLLNE